MIKICKYSITVFENEEDEKEGYLLKMHFLREDLGWKWIPVSTECLSMKRVDREIQKLSDEGYELFRVYEES